jgi:hypothetical protein
VAWSYQSETDVLTITFDHGEAVVARTHELKDGTADLDARGLPVRVILHHASLYCPGTDLRLIDRPHVPGEKLHSISTAARMLGIRAYSLRRAILAGAVPMVKSGASWCLRPCVVTIYRAVLDLAKQAAPTW